MKASIAILVLLSLFTTVASSLVVGATRGHALMRSSINPKLDPKSDQVFFRSDYPDDSDAHSATVHHKPPAFTHPYPALQDSNNFDADYVKDENNDNGEWKAQMTYDLLRSKTVKRREDRMHKQNTLDEIRFELEEARKRYVNATDVSAKAKKDLEASNGALGSAKARYKRLAAGGGAAADSIGSKGSVEVEAAMKEVKVEMRHLEKCRKQLAEARRKLKALLAVPPGGVAAKAPSAAPPPGMAPGPALPPAPGPAAAHAPAPSPVASPAFAPAPAKKPTHRAKREVDDELSKLEKASASADAAAAGKAAEYAEAKREAAKRLREADEEAERHRTFQLEKEEESKQLKEDEGELKKAAARLRRFRQAEDSDGGVYWKNEHERGKDDSYVGMSGKNEHEGGKKKDAVQDFPPFEGATDDGAKKSAAASRGSGFLFTTFFMVAAVAC